MGLPYSLYKVKPELLPEADGKPTFDPHYGFEKKRKPRVMVATKEEMIAAKIPHELRDYCAHLLLEYLACAEAYRPFPVMCKPEKHKYLNCEYDDYVLRLKEFERERRLKLRQARLEGKA